MPDIDVLDEALHHLQRELESFKSATEQLKESHRQREAELERWTAQHDLDAQAIRELLSATGEARSFALVSAERTEALAVAMRLLGEQVAAVGFPERLDRMDSAVSALRPAIEELREECRRARIAAVVWSTITTFFLLVLGGAVGFLIYSVLNRSGIAGD